MNKVLLPFKILGLFVLAAYAMWLCLWNIVEASTICFNTGVWQPEIIINGIPSIFIGIVILITVTMLGVRVLK